MTRTIDYGNLMHRAMRGLIQEVLAGVAVNGLPGKHHFFITFDTQHPDVEIADWLSQGGRRSIVVAVSVVMALAFFLLAQMTPNPSFPEWSRLGWISGDRFHSIYAEHFVKKHPSVDSPLLLS